MTDIIGGLIGLTVIVGMGYLIYKKAVKKNPELENKVSNFLKPNSKTNPKEIKTHANKFPEKRWGI